MKTVVPAERERARVTGDLVIADTDVASHLMRGTLSETLARRLAGRSLGLTFVTIGELHRGAAHAGWGDRRRAALADWLERLPVLEGSERVARRWGELTGTARRAGAPLPANDAWVAACCLVHAAPLATLNLRRYAQVEDLRVIETT